MSTSQTNATPEDLLRRLMEQAKATWGEARAQEIQATLEQTSRQVSEVSRNLPDKETEPGFYQ